MSDFPAGIATSAHWQREPQDMHDVMEREDRKERLRAGKRLRQSVPREVHAQLLGSGTRSALEIMAQDDVHRIKWLLPLRYKRMAKTPFSFLRGAAAVMAEDLAEQPQTGLTVQACGDAHLMNFGAFVTPEHNIAFDVNDFDETLPNIDFTVDLKRLAASVAVAARDAKLSDKEAHRVSAIAVKAYRKTMYELSQQSPLCIRQSKIDLRNEIASFNTRAKQKLQRIIDRATNKDPKDDNFPEIDKHDHKLVDKNCTMFHPEGKRGKDLKLDLKQLFATYCKGVLPDRRQLLSRYQLQDAVFKAVGIGSVGRFCYVALFETEDRDWLLLQVKEARASVLERFKCKAVFSNDQGRRVVEGQRMMQAASDIFLGYSRDIKSGRDFYVRAFKNRRLDDISDVGQSDALAEYSALCGKTLARAHARSGQPASIAGYMGKSEVMDNAVASFAVAYIGRNAADHAQLVKSGRHDLKCQET
jgi:uncharacterized protein (DUF2252 family)